ncbi:MAG: pyridoxamine 5'-phosphate oxidase family protein [Coriobacteriales bacterium]|nr:pyridoxamine 5'-phosphate oxidase family protein [Coriobacteriales bacterium]
MTAIEEVCAFLQEAGTYYLATCEGDQPRVRPFGTAHIFEDKLYIQSGKVKDVAKQLEANPKFEISAFKGGTWIRVSGKLVEDPRIEAQESMLEANPNLKRMYAAGDGNTVVYYLSDAEATFSSFTEGPRTLNF